MNLKAEWKCVIINFGGLCVIDLGVQQMPMYYVNN